MSPVETCGFPVNSTIIEAWVPFPAPGGPKRTMDPDIFHRQSVHGKIIRIRARFVPTKYDHMRPIDPLSTHPEGQ